MKGSDARVHTDGVVVDQKILDHSLIDSPTNFTINVSFGSTQHVLSIPSHFTFGDLKQAIARELGVESEMQRLLFRGIEKDDNDRLSMVGVKDHSKILLMVDETLREENHEEVMAPIEVVSIGGHVVSEVREEVDNLSGQLLAVEAYSKWTQGSGRRSCYSKWNQGCLFAYKE